MTLSRKIPYRPNDSLRLSVRRILDNIIVEEDGTVYIGYMNEKKQVVFLSVSKKFHETLKNFENVLTSIRKTEREIESEAGK